MHRLFATAMALLCAAVLLPAQAPARAPAATGLVVGSGNFFSPIVADLDTAVAFYRDGLGLDAGPPANADDNAPLRKMFGLPGAKLRWTVARPAGLRSGVEIVEITNVARHALNQRVQDQGAVTLVLRVPDLERIRTRLALPADSGGLSLSDPDGHFIELSESRVPVGSSAPPVDVRIRLTVDSLDGAMRLYRDALGLKQLALDEPAGSGKLARRTASVQVPTSGLVIEFAEYMEAGRRRVRGEIQDPGSTRMQLQVRDLAAAMRAIVNAGGRVISTGGMPVELPAGRGGSIRAAIVRDPNNLFVVLIESRAP